MLFTCKQGCLQTCKYDKSLSVTEIQSFMVIYGFFFELWVLNLNKEEEEEEEEEKKKMKNSAHHSPMMGRTLVIPIYKALLCFVIGMAKVLPIIDILGYDGQNSSFSSSSSPPSDSTPITQKGSHINMKLCGYVGFCNAKRLVILTCL